MINWLATLFGRFALFGTILFTIAACGGGGGGGGAEGGGFLPPEPEVPPTYFVTLALYDVNGNPTSTFTSTYPATLEVLVTTDSTIDPQPISGQVIEASTTLGAVLPASGTALTNGSGVATFELIANGDLGAGAATVTVDGPLADSEQIIATLNYQIEAAPLRLGHYEGTTFIDGAIGLNAPNLTAGGTADLRFAVIDETGERVQDAQEIRLSSGCQLSGLATVPPSVTTSLGLATASYVDLECAGVDEITAKLFPSGVTATATLNIAPPLANGILFQSVTPESGFITLRGTGDLANPERASVSFQVLTGSTSTTPGTPIAGAKVSFTLSSDIHGLTLVSNTVTSDNEGSAVAVVQAGNQPVTFRVTATIDADIGDGQVVPVSTISTPIIVSTGIPDQNSISLSANFGGFMGVTEAISVPGAATNDGIEVEFVVRMADKFNNPVAEGTIALFTTEYGRIQESCVIEGGICSVIWNSQSPRTPLNNAGALRTINTPEFPDLNYACSAHNNGAGPCPDNFGQGFGWHSTVLVTAQGEESFTDENGNGVYDSQEPWVNLPEAFVDHNEDEVFTPALGPACPSYVDPLVCSAAGAEETFIDYDGDEAYSLNDNPAEFNGLLCPIEGDGRWCSRTRVDVRDSMVLVMSPYASNLYTILVDSGNSSVDKTVEDEVFSFYVSDQYNNPPPLGTTITTSVSGGCELVIEPKGEIVETQLSGAKLWRVKTAGNGEPGTVSFALKTPDGSETTTTFNCVSFPDPEECDPATDPDCLVPGG